MEEWAVGDNGVMWMKTKLLSIGGSSLDGTIGAWQNLIENYRLLLQMLLCKIMIKVKIFSSRSLPS